MVAVSAGSIQESCVGKEKAGGLHHWIILPRTSCCFPFLLDAGITLGKTQESGRVLPCPCVHPKILRGGSGNHCMDPSMYGRRKARMIETYKNLHLFFFLRKTTQDLFEQIPLGV